jgi:hypothetical protein
MTGRYEYELIRTDDKKERLRADDHYLEGTSSSSSSLTRMALKSWRR